MEAREKIVGSNTLKELISKNILHFISESIIATNLNGEIVYWNVGAERIYGYAEDEVLGKTPAILYPNRNEKRLRDDLDKMLRGVDYKGEWEGRRKDGQVVWVNIKMSTLKNDINEIVGFIGVSYDITEQKQMVKELIQSETKYQTIFENSGEGFFLMTDTFIDVNKKVCEIFGYKKNEIIGKSPLDFSPEKQPDGSLSKEMAAYYIKKAINEGQVSFYWQHLNRAKKIIETYITITRVRIRGESLLIAIMQDMTEMLEYQEKLKAKTRELALQNEKVSKLNDDLSESNARLKIINKQIELNERKFRMAFITSPDSININRMSDGLYVDINEGFTRLTGYTEDDVKGKTSTKLDIWVNTKERKKLVNGLKKDEHISNLEAQFRKKDGSISTALMSASIIEINGEKHILSITRDISERKEQEKLLKEAMQKAEESDMLKSAFLANMSHEIRTPMNAILGFSQLLKEKKIEKAKQDKYLDIIITRSQNLLQIINDIIDISKIEANQLNIEIQEFSLNKLLYELFTQYEAELITQNKSAVTLYFNSDLDKAASYILSDEHRLKQILTNLISNAIKFTEKGRIEFGYKVKGSILEFFVRDTGVGIPKEAQNRIFERFRQADDSNTREFGGTGLGLSISKQLVELLGGKIWVESKVSDGSTFYFTISFNPIVKAEKQNGTQIEEQYNFFGKNILIVEDDLIGMLYLGELLDSTKANILKAESGIQAIEIFKSYKNIDLVLMDINMPQMNGNIATKEIKKIKKSVPVIVQSAFAMPNDKKESFKHGCDDFITKPIDGRLLLSMIKKFLH
ncbi:MAG TPA: hypothetical protein DCG75_18355 [Bacteroidales bacterium]|nr:hypothetical protein [Bacteroidales bacterium]